MSANEELEGGVADTQETSVAEEVTGDGKSKDESPTKESDAIEKAHRMTGTKQRAVNLPGVVTEKRKGVKKGTKETGSKLPSFFVKPDTRIRADMDILYSKETGQLLSVQLKELMLDPDAFEYLGYQEVCLVFSQPRYDELATYRQRAMVFNSRAGKMLVEPVKLRNFLIVHHLVEWNLTDDEGNQVPLVRDGEMLAGDSLKLIDSLHPTILDVALTKFEMEILLQ